MDNKKLIKQYVETGVCLTPHQLASLNNNLLDTYFHRRLMMEIRLDPHEVEYLPDSKKSEYVEYIVKKGEDLTDVEFEILSPDEADVYFKRRMKKLEERSERSMSDPDRSYHFFNSFECRYLKHNKELFQRYMELVCDVCISLKAVGSLVHVEFMPDDLIAKFFRAKIKDVRNEECKRVSVSTLKSIPEVLIRPYFEARLKTLKDKVNRLKSKHPREQFEKYMKIIYINFEGYEMAFVPEDIKLELKHFIETA